MACSWGVQWQHCARLMRSLRTAAPAHTVRHAHAIGNPRTRWRDRPAGPAAAQREQQALVAPAAVPPTGPARRWLSLSTRLRSQAGDGGPTSSSGSGGGGASASADGSTAEGLGTLKRKASARAAAPSGRPPPPPTPPRWVEPPRRTSESPSALHASDLYAHAMRCVSRSGSTPQGFQCLAEWTAALWTASDTCLKSPPPKPNPASQAHPRLPSPPPPPRPAPPAPRQLADALGRVSEAKRVADVEALRAALASKEHDAGADGVWDDAAAGQALMAEISELKSELQEISGCAGGGGGGDMAAQPGRAPRGAPPASGRCHGRAPRHGAATAAAARSAGGARRNHRRARAPTRPAPRARAPPPAPQLRGAPGGGRLCRGADRGGGRPRRARGTRAAVRGALWAGRPGGRARALGAAAAAGGAARRQGRGGDDTGGRGRRGRHGLGGDARAHVGRPRPGGVAVGARRARAAGAGRQGWPHDAWPGKIAEGHGAVSTQGAALHWVRRARRRRRPPAAYLRQVHALGGGAGLPRQCGGARARGGGGREERGAGGGGALRLRLP
jgi:hypothetical protein